MNSVMRHLWYLKEDTVVFGLFDPGLSDAEKQEIATALLRIPPPRNRLPLGKPAMPMDIIAGAGYPQLSSFVGNRSWKLWEVLAVGSAWLQQPVQYWQDSPDFQTA